METTTEQPKKKGLFGKILKAVVIIVIGLAAKGKIRGAVGDIAKDVDPEIVEKL